MMKHLLIWMALVALVTACRKDEPEPRIPCKADRTVVVYMSAENTLSSYASTDIQEMVDGIANVSANNNLIVFVDRCVASDKPFIAKIRKDKDTPVDTLYRYDKDFYASDPTAMAEVLSRIIDLCPAEDYGLVLWGHANGWIIENNAAYKAPRRAYGVDNGKNASGSDLGLWLNIPDLRTVLEQVGVKWKYIFCDCCCMQGVEVAYELRDRADYLIGAPSEIPGVGAPYSTVTADLFKRNDEAMYTGVCDHYYESANGHLPLSVVRLQNMQLLADATKEILPQVGAFIQQEDATKGIIYYYAPNGMYNDTEKNMYDMRDMIRAALTGYAEEYQRWDSVFGQTVLHPLKASYWETQRNNTVNFSDFTVTDEKFGGISMFFPLAKYDAAQKKYNTLVQQMEWYKAVGW
jgi:hypothetical protein